MTVVALSFLVFSLTSAVYMQILSGMVYIFGSTLVVVCSFLIWSELTVVTIVVTWLTVVVWAFYLNYDIRRMVRGHLYDNLAEDAWSGAVRIWLEVLFVFCRLIELIGGMFFKTKH